VAYIANCAGDLVGWNRHRPADAEEIGRKRSGAACHKSKESAPLWVHLWLFSICTKGHALSYGAPFSICCATILTSSALLIGCHPCPLMDPYTNEPPKYGFVVVLRNSSKS